MLYTVLRKTVFYQKQHFLHLNLSVALLLGLITFIGGIENANKYRVRLKVHSEVLSIAF